MINDSDMTLVNDSRKESFNKLSNDSSFWINFNTVVNFFLQMNAAKTWLYVKASHKRFGIKTLEFFCKCEGINNSILIRS